MAEKPQPATIVSNGQSNGHDTTPRVPKITKAKTDDTDLDDYFVQALPWCNGSLYI